jgi:hypothetical protein
MDTEIGSMALPDGLPRAHVSQAIAQLDRGASHPFGASKDYDLVVNGKRYPPKAALGLAAAITTGKKFGLNDFSGGEGPGQANAVLRSLGFEVESKDGPPTVVDQATEMAVAFTVSDCELFTK